MRRDTQTAKRRALEAPVWGFKSLSRYSLVIDVLFFERFTVSRMRNLTTDNGEDAGFDSSPCRKRPRRGINAACSSEVER